MGSQEEDSFVRIFDQKLAKKQDSMPKKICLKIIMERNLKNIDPKTNNNNNQDEIEIKANQLLKLTHIHLDREGIDEIDNLVEYLGDIRNLYLQHNLIRRIENLDFFKNLKFLVLSNNKIEKVENVKQLINLKFLDLSHNLIKHFEIEEFPISLSFLDLRVNECVSNKKSWEEFVTKSQDYFTKLIELNGQNIMEMDKEKYTNINYDQSIDQIINKIVQRSNNRQNNDKESFQEKWFEKKQVLESLKINFNKKLSNI